jgi:hypothetical protein
MSERPTAGTVAELAEFLLRTFRISPAEAGEHASKFLSLQDSSRMDDSPVSDWQFIAKQEFADKLPWRSDAEHEQFQLDQALTRHFRPPPLTELVSSHDRAGFREALRRIVKAGHISDSDAESLKYVAAASTDPFGPNDWWKHEVLKYEALIALTVGGRAEDPAVIGRLDELLNRYLADLRPGLYYKVPAALLILAGAGGEPAAASLRLALQHAPVWSVRIACLYGLPESRDNGTYRLIENFRQWLNEGAPETSPDLRYYCENWRPFMMCLTREGLCALIGQETRWPAAPLADFSPLIDWAADHGHTEWLVNEFDWLRKRGSIDVWAMRNRMLQRGMPAAVEFCLEQVKKAAYEDYTQYDATYNLLRLHPKPLPGIALDLCLYVVRHPCHPGKFEHRIDALKHLVEAAQAGRYPATEVKDLVVKVAETDFDVDVRSAAIEKLPWAAPDKIRETLAPALDHESSRIRDAALRALNHSRLASDG